MFSQHDEDFIEEQNYIARLIQMLHNDDPEEMLKVLVMFIIQSAQFPFPLVTLFGLFLFLLIYEAVVMQNFLIL